METVCKLRIAIKTLLILRRSQTSGDIMSYRKALSNLFWRFVFVIGWNAVPYYAYISSNRRSDLGNLPFGLMAFAGMILAAVLLGKSIGDFVTATANKISQP